MPRVLCQVAPQLQHGGQRQAQPAKLLARRAHALDSFSSGAHLAMGSYYFHEYDWEQAEIEKAWADEAVSRAEALARGDLTAEDGASAMAELRAELGTIRSK